ENHVVSRKHAIIRHLQTRQSGGAGNGSDLLDILPGIDGDDSRRVRGLAGVYAGDSSVRVNRAQERNVESIGKLDVIDIVPEALNQTRILGALHSLSNILGHKSSAS